MRQPQRQHFLFLSLSANFVEAVLKPFFPLSSSPPLFKFMLFSSHLYKSFSLFYHYFLHSTTWGDSCDPGNFIGTLTKAVVGYRMLQVSLQEQFLVESGRVSSGLENLRSDYLYS